MDLLLSQEPPPEPPLSRESTPISKSTWLSRDDRIRIQTMRDLGYSQYRIAEILGFTKDQIQYTYHSNLTPRKPSGQPSKLSPTQMDEIIDFITHSKRNRQMTYSRLIKALDLGVSVHCLQLALKNRGYRRYPALKKPPLSEPTRLARLSWAKEHINWTMDQWYNVLWTDETWVTNQNHRKIYVTRKSDEDLEPTCLIERRRKGKGWMFWGSISGHTKGPALFWEKDWGTINKTSYCEKIVPIIHG